MPFYNYSYDSVKLIRSLCHDSRDLYMNNQDAMIRMFKKQTLDIRERRIDENTIKVLLRGDRYKLFNIKVDIDPTDIDRTEMFYNMLDAIPELEFQNIAVRNKCDKEFIDILLQKSIYKTKEELFEVLYFNDMALNDTEDTYEYFNDILYPEKHDMSCFTKQAGSILLKKLDKDMNID